MYETALYLRLSKDDADIDGGKKTESNSIGSQRDILRAYLMEISLQYASFTKFFTGTMRLLSALSAYRLSKPSVTAIKRNKLNRSGVLSPMEYKRALGIKYHTGFAGDSPAKWAAVSVKRILENPVYTGTMVQGKEEKVNYKLKKRIHKPRDEWICVKNTHEAIISEVEFLTVQDLLKYDPV